MQNTQKLTTKDKELIQKAEEHAKECYREGLTSMAALLRTKNGNLYTGINVKYKKVWKCICAERVAIAKAIEAGETDFDTIVTVKYESEDETFKVMNMCGECRQVAVFHTPLHVLTMHKKEIISVSIEEVFPYPYS
jgi:cytidine deaminase